MNDLLIELSVGGDAKVTLNGTILEKCDITIKLEYDFQDEVEEEGGESDSEHKHETRVSRAVESRFNYMEPV